LENSQKKKSKPSHQDHKVLRTQIQVFKYSMLLPEPQPISPVKLHDTKLNAQSI